MSACAEGLAQLAPVLSLVVTLTMAVVVPGIPRSKLELWCHRPRVVARGCTICNIVVLYETCTSHFRIPWHAVMGMWATSLRPYVRRLWLLRRSDRGWSDLRLLLHMHVCTTNLGKTTCGACAMHVACCSHHARSHHAVAKRCMRVSGGHKGRNGTID